MANKSISRTVIRFGDYYIPVVHHKEFRNSVRFSITKKGLVVRSPILMNSTNIRSNAEVWVKNLASNKPAALGKFKIKNYTSGDTLQLMETTYTLYISSHSSSSDKIVWADKKIHAYINDNYSDYAKSQAMRSLLANYAKKKFITPVKERVKDINQRFFQVEINKVSLKHNHSNWGSCSSKGNINLSSRLLFAPLEVMDYVIIHELAHRYEMNHSKKFWSIVAKACPDYKKHETWLKKNSHLCEF